MGDTGDVVQEPPRRWWTRPLTLLFWVHGLGALVSFLVFSYQYVREAGFWSWLLLGEVVPMVKATVWEVFVVIALVQPAPAVRASDAWWASHYADLFQAVDNSERGSLRASYRAGPTGDATVSVALHMTADGGVVQVVIPEGALSVSNGSGALGPVDSAVLVTMRDHDFDGIPDDYRHDDGASLGYDGRLAEKQFTELTSSPEHQGIMAVWHVAVSFCVNYFLDGVNTALPVNPG